MRLCRRGSKLDGSTKMLRGFVPFFFFQKHFSPIVLAREIVRFKAGRVCKIFLSVGIFFLLGLGIGEITTCRRKSRSEANSPAKMHFSLRKFFPAHQDNAEVVLRNRIIFNYRERMGE